MKLRIAAIGKAKPSPEQKLYVHYLERLPWNLTLIEQDSKKQDLAARKQDEAELLLKACEGYDILVALDEKGKDLTSRDFARQIEAWQNQGNSSIAFIIGGADGLDNSVRQKAHLVWSMGRITWPHMLMRGLLAEQLYRAYSILHNHPYHRD